MIVCYCAGGTIVHVLDDIVARGADASQIIVVCVVAAPPALKKLSEKYLGDQPGLQSPIEHTRLLRCLAVCLSGWLSLCVFCSMTLPCFAPSSAGWLQSCPDIDNC